MTKNFPSFTKDINLQIQELELTSNRVNSKKSTIICPGKYPSGFKRKIKTFSDESITPF